MPVELPEKRSLLVICKKYLSPPSTFITNMRFTIETGAALPRCTTENVLFPIASNPIRAWSLVLGATLNVTVPTPTPLVADVIVIQLFAFETVQAQLPEAPTTIE